MKPKPGYAGAGLKAKAQAVRKPTAPVKKAGKKNVNTTKSVPATSGKDAKAK